MHDLANFNDGYKLFAKDFGAVLIQSRESSEEQYLYKK